MGADDCLFIRKEGVFVLLFSKQCSFLSLFLLVACMLLVFCACEGSMPNTEDTGDLTEAGILASDLQKYSIVTSVTATAKEIDASMLLKKTIAEKYGVQLTVANDSQKAGDGNDAVSDYEMLVGQTSRAQSRAFVQGLRASDYGYTLSDRKIVISGTNGADTYKAVERFIADVLNRQISDVFMRQADEFYHREVYTYQAVKINGAELSEYAISYQKGGENLPKTKAKQLQSHLAAEYGYLLEMKVEEDSRGGKEIRIGIPSSDETIPMAAPLAAGEYYVGMHQGNLYLYAGSTDALSWAVQSFIDILKDTAVITDGTASVEFGEGEILRKINEISTAMTFNILYQDITDARVERVTTLIKNNLPDVIGFQEATLTWMNKLNDALKSTYASVGEGRDGGQAGEYNPIFYQKDKFTLITSGTKWLSDTPERVSKYSESTLNRIMTYAVLKRNSDGATFLYVNTHLEHTSSDARIKQAQALINIIRDLPDYPIVLMGDFNATSGTVEYNIVASEVVNAATIAISKQDPGLTFHKYGASSKVIDFIFVSEERFTVEHYRVVTDKVNGEYASDHHPVLIRYSLNP